MMILHVCRSDTEGGAAIAARRLHDALTAHGVDSRMMVIHKNSDDPRISAPLGATRTLMVRAARFVARRLAQFGATYARDATRSLGLFPSGLGREISRSEADIVHLHWVGAETLSLGEIAAIRQPVVWTQHDIWAFNGAHHWGNLGADILGSVPGARQAPFDVDRWTERRKKRLWRDLRAHIVCPSAWLADRLLESDVLHTPAFSIIANTLDTDIFTLQDRAAARAALGLPDGPVLLFGAVGGSSNPIKGGDLLARVLQILHGRGVAMTVLVFGGPAPAEMPYPAVELGTLSGDAALASVYAAADVFTCPSRVENLPNTVLEAQCCGVPAVGFSSSGQADAIGAPERLADPFDCAALADVIERLFTHPPAPETIRAETISRVAPEIVVQRHIALYRALLADPVSD